jgi:hypothetical protein
LRFAVIVRQLSGHSDYIPQLQSWKITAPQINPNAGRRIFDVNPLAQWAWRHRYTSGDHYLRAIRRLARFQNAYQSR